MKKLMKKEGKLKELVLFEIGIKTGLRISDILKLTWNDVYSELGENQTFRHSIVITEKKTGKSKQFRLSDSVKESVNQLIGLDNPQKADFMFISDSNSVTTSKSAWTRQYVWQFLNDYGYRSGIKEENKVKKLERELHKVGKDFDFFPTPPAAVQEVIRLAGIEKGMEVLEPSAGSGNLADAIKKAFDSKTLSSK